MQNTIIFSLIIIALGCLLHFTYAWSHQNKFVGMFSATSESVWDHIKIALVPIYLCFIFDWQSVTAAVLALATVAVTIPAIFFFEKLILKRNYLVIDIIIFCISVFLSQYVYHFSMLTFPDVIAWPIFGIILIGTLLSSSLQTKKSVVK